VTAARAYVAARQKLMGRLLQTAPAAASACRRRAPFGARLRAQCAQDSFLAARAFARS